MIYLGRFFLVCALVSTSSCSKVPTYAAHCARPLAHWKTPTDGYGDWPHNDIVVSRKNGLSWNGVPINRKQFYHFLSAVPTLDPQPDVILMFGPELDCATVIEMRNFVDKNLDCQELRRCGEGVGDWKGNTHISHMPSAEMQAELGNLVDSAVERARR